MKNESFVLSENWKEQIAEYVFRAGYGDNAYAAECLDVVFPINDLTITTEDGRVKHKFTWAEAMEIDACLREVCRFAQAELPIKELRLPTVSELIGVCNEIAGDGLDGEDVVSELELQRNGIGHPVGRGVAEHEGEWAAYWTSTEVPFDVTVPDEHMAYALVITELGVIKDRERVDTAKRLSIRPALILKR